MRERLSEIFELYSRRKVGFRLMARQSVFPSHSGRVFIPWRFQAIVFSSNWIWVAVWSDWSIPLEVVPQSVIWWLKEDEMLKTSSIWFECFLLKLVHVV